VTLKMLSTNAMARVLVATGLPSSLPGGGGTGRPGVDGLEIVEEGGLMTEEEEGGLTTAEEEEIEEEEGGLTTAEEEEADLRTAEEEEAR
jgi:hypothetical protein